MTGQILPDYTIPAALVTGLLLFFAARLLASSVMFRLSAGTALFTLGSMLILLVLLLRWVGAERGPRRMWVFVCGAGDGGGYPADAMLVGCYYQGGGAGGEGGSFARLCITHTTPDPRPGHKPCTPTPDPRL